MKTWIGIIVFIAAGGLLAWYLLYADKEPSVPAIVQQAPEQGVQAPKPAVEPPSVEAEIEMIAGVPANSTNGQFAAERPADLDPFRRWAPPVARTVFMDKSEKIMLEKHPYAASAEYRGVFFHLGFKDKPATCGEVKLFGHDGNAVGDFERFVYSGRASLHLQSELPEIFDGIWKKLCVDTMDDPADTASDNPVAS